MCDIVTHAVNSGYRIVEYHRKKIFLNSASSAELEMRTVFGPVTSAPVTSPPKQFCSLFPSSIDLSHWATEINFTGTRSQEIWLFSFNVHAEEQCLCSWRRFSVVLNFRAAGTALSGTPTVAYFLGVLRFFYNLILVSRNKRAKFDADLCIRSRTIIEDTYR
jgi:hypothetical protein